MRKTVFLLAFFVLLSGAFLYVPVSSAEEAPVFPETPEAAAVYFYHIESGRKIGSVNERQVLPAGSTGKVIAGLIACEQLGNRLTETFLITADMVADSAGHRYRIAAGDMYTGEQLLYLAVCGSYNDAFDVLACLIDGDKPAFVNRMNQRAEELGAVGTRYTDPSGVSDSSFTTAEDLFRISLAAAENPLYMRICGSEVYFMPERIYNRNALISRSEYTQYYNPKCQGMSAGETENGKCCLVTVAQNGNDRYLCVILGAESTDDTIYSYSIANRLIKWGYENYTYLEVITPKTSICTLPVRVSDLTEKIEVRAAESASYFLPAGATVGKDVIFSIRLMYESLEAPVTEGTHVGYLAVVYDGEVLGTVPLYTAGSAERSGFVSRLMQIRSLTESRRVRAGGIFFLIAVVGWIGTETVLRIRRKRKWDKYFSRKIDLPETILQRRK